MESTETKTIQIVVNGEPKRVPDGLNLMTLLVLLAVDASRVAVEHDRKIVRKAEWEVTPLRDGAEIEIVWFVGGG